MILSGGGQNLSITGKNLKVSVSAEFQRKDISGQTSSSSFATAGNKKTVSVSLQIPTDAAGELSKLFKLAEAIDAKGDPIIYSIVDDQCDVAGIRQVIFAGSLRSQENDSLRCYDVSFELMEQKPAAAKKEERAQAKAAAAAPAAKDGEVKVGSADPDKVAEAAKLK